jgi:(p)ppGpp synthase/HD superfamily hydrolase
MDNIKLAAYPLIDLAQRWATECHANANHLYDGLPYSAHLAMVASVGGQFIQIIPEGSREAVLASCWAHDTIEYTRKTYNDVKNALGSDVADIVYALTNEKGKTRKDRANAKYYRGIRDTPYATFVKVCDRIADVTYSKETGSSMFNAYVKENTIFMDELYHPTYEALFDQLEAVLEEANK